MVNFRGEKPEQILSIVYNVEAISPHLPKHERLNSKREAYIHNKTWLKISDYENKLFKITTWRRFFGSIYRSKFRQALTDVLSNRQKIADTSIFATHVRVKNNIIALYPDLGMACKIKKPHSFRNKNSLENEYSILRDLERFRPNLAPRPIAYENEPVPNLWMKYVKGRRVKTSEKEVISEKIAEILFDWYEYCNVDKVSIHEYEPLIKLLESGVDHIKSFGWGCTEAETLYKTLQVVAETNIKLLISQIHGDISTGNVMISTNGNIIITDWENSRRDLISIDVYKLVVNNLNLKDMYIEKFTTKMNISSIELEIGLYLSQILLYIDINKRRYYYNKIVCYDLENTEIMLIKDRKKVFEACQSVKQCVGMTKIK